MPERRLIIGACAAWAEWSALSDLWLACGIVFSGVRPSTMHTPGVFFSSLSFAMALPSFNSCDGCWSSRA